VGNSSSTTSSTTNTTTGEVPVEHVVQASDVWPTFDATAAVAAAVVTTPTSASEASSTGVGLTGVGPTGVTLSVSTEFGLYGSGATETLVGVNLAACAAPDDGDRAPVDVVVVSDVSGSMAGDKMTLLKETVTLLLGELAAKDRVGLVTFDDVVKEALALSAMDGARKAQASAAVGKFAAGSCTNLSGGLFAGVEMLLRAARDEAKDNNNATTKGKDKKRTTVKTVLLMTDGQANRGLQGAGAILPVLTKMLAGTGIALHTFGYGADHDSGLLREVATTGAGSYYYVESADDIRSAFGDCLGGMLSVVAQNLELELDPGEGHVIAKVHHSAATAAGGGRWRVPFADLYGDEQRDVLVTLALPAASSSTTTTTVDPPPVALRCTLRYIDVLTAAPGVTEATTTPGRSSAAGALDAATQGARDPRLELHATRLAVAEALDLARGEAERGDLVSARARIVTAQAAVATSSSSCGAADGAAEMFPAFADDLRECAEGLVDKTAFYGKRHKMAMLSKGHLEQRCCESASVQMPAMVSVGSSSFGGAAEPQMQQQQMRGNAYRTTAKRSKASKFSAKFSGMS